MFNQIYYHGLLRKYVSIFGGLFNNIVVQRFDESDNKLQTLAVPIRYGPKQKFMVRRTELPEESSDPQREIMTQLPRMSFEITDISRVGSQQLFALTKNVKLDSNNPDDPDVLRRQFVYVPYNVGFELNIHVKNADDGSQIVEQIIPYFTPDLTVTVKTVENMDYTDDIRITHEGISFADDWEGQFDDRRILIWTLSFNMNCRFYGPESLKGVIKRTQIDFLIPSGYGPVTDQEVEETPRTERLVLTPGLLANGSPTTDSSLSIPYQDINAADDWGFAEDIFNYYDGKKYDPVSGTDKRVKGPDDEV